MNTSSLNALAPSWRALIGLCEDINFGYLEDLEVRDGEPVSYGLAIKTIMPGPNKENGPAMSRAGTRAGLKPQWLEVFALASGQRTLKVKRLDIAHGAPLKLLVETARGGLHG